jgi:hypothetical protein
MLLAAGVCGNLIANDIALNSLTLEILLLKSVWVSVGLLVISSCMQANLEYSGFHDRLREAVFDDIVQEMRATMKGSANFLSPAETKRLLDLE